MKGALRAINAGWTKLRKAPAWDESRVREWTDVAYDARKRGEEVHMGNLFDFCVEKNPHLPEGDQRRKYKARVVFQGNRVINQDWEAAMFQDLGNAPATMEASRSVDCYGCLPGHVEEQSDARQAYIQAFLKGRRRGRASPRSNGHSRGKP